MWCVVSFMFTFMSPCLLRRPLFLMENDFSICMKESFPQLKMKKLRRVEWCKIRRLMGKPRRYYSFLYVSIHVVYPT